MTDARPPPWYKKLISPLTRAWEWEKNEWREAGEEALRRNPRDEALRQEIAHIAWEAFRGRISHDEGFRLIAEARHRRETALQQLVGNPSAEDELTHD